MFFGFSSFAKILENRFFGKETREQDEHAAILGTRMAIDYYALDSDRFEMFANYINIPWTYYSDPSIPTFYSLARKAKNLSARICDPPLSVSLSNSSKKKTLLQ
jgi:hypothetical protein